MLLALLIILAIVTFIIAIFPRFSHTRYLSKRWFFVMVCMPWVLVYENFVLGGFRQNYISMSTTFSMLLIFNCSLQGGVLTFLQAMNMFVYSVVVLTSGLVYQQLVFAQSTEIEAFRLDDTLVTNISFFVFTSACTLFNKYTNLKTEVAAFNNTNLDASSHSKAAEFVDRLLPKHVRESVASNISVMDIEENVTLLFADIVGFTNYSSDKNPTQVVDMLSKLFTAFDIECNNLNLYKVYTIGDCYVVMSFLDKNNRLKPEQECDNVARLGFKMIEIIAKVRREINFDGLHMRIGIHTGKIIGGVIGTGIIRYDMYGQDVLIANKMESSGESDMIQVSEATKQHLTKLDRQAYVYKPNGDIEIKALGRKVKGYFLERKAKSIVIAN